MAKLFLQLIWCKTSVGFVKLRLLNGAGVARLLTILGRCMITSLGQEKSVLML